MQLIIHVLNIEINIKLSIYNSNFRLYKWTNLNWYEGDFKSGEINDKGDFKCVDKRIYEGEWKNNKAHGGGKNK